MRRRLIRILLLFLATAPLAGGCADPPSKEMHEAQGAIDAARAAGADKYAEAEYDAAVQALARADEAVEQRDYRLALNHALDARERAKEAARAAAEAQARARGDAERLLSDVTQAVALARTRLATAESQRPRRRGLEEPRKTLEAADQALQEAGTALAAQDYARARTALEGVADRVRAAMLEIDEPARAAPGRANRPASRPR